MKQLLLTEGNVTKIEGNTSLRQLLAKQKLSRVKTMVRFTSDKASAVRTENAKKIIRSIIKDNENMVFSPLALYYALLNLSVTFNGAYRESLHAKMNFSSEEGSEKVGNEINAISQLIEEAQSDVSQLKIANSLWLTKRYPINHDFAELILAGLPIEIYTCNFGERETDKEMRLWLNTQTNGLIKDMVKDFKTKTGEVFEQLSTVYFKSKWVDVFCVASDESLQFKTPEGCVSAEFITNRSIRRLYKGERFEGIVLSLEGGNKMCVCKPNEGTELDELENDDEALRFLLFGEMPSSTMYNMKAYVPQFKSEVKLNLKETIKTLGLDTCLCYAGDGESIIHSSDNIVVEKGEQNTKIVVDEKGIEGASMVRFLGYSGGLLPVTYPEYTFRADRPFIYSVINEDIRAMPIFVGAVVNSTNN